MIDTRTLDGYRVLGGLLEGELHIKAFIDGIVLASLQSLTTHLTRVVAASTNITPQNIAVNAEEEQLVSMMLKAIEEHLEDENYNADQLARDVAMSRASLYNKLKTMLGITPTDFIRNVRLKRAARLLEDTNLGVNEIAARVGFVTARNFSSQFKKMFGLNPSEYREGRN